VRASYHSEFVRRALLLIEHRLRPNPTTTDFL
jgi:hypothetical protein